MKIILAFHFRFNICINELPLRRGFEALSKLDNSILDVLFPTEVKRVRDLCDLNIGTIRWFNKDLNYEQRKAVNTNHFIVSFKSFSRLPISCIAFRLNGLLPWPVPIRL